MMSKDMEADGASQWKNWDSDAIWIMAPNHKKLKLEMMTMMMMIQLVMIPIIIIVILTVQIYERRW